MMLVSRHCDRKLLSSLHFSTFLLIRSSLIACLQTIKSVVRRSNRYPFPGDSKSNVVYQFSCRGCESSYIGKTERTLFQRTKEYVTRADSAIKGHLDNCSNVEHLFSINNVMLNDVNKHKFTLNLVRQNTIIIDQSCN